MYNQQLNVLYFCIDIPKYMKKRLYTNLYFSMKAGLPEKDALLQIPTIITNDKYKS